MLSLVELLFNDVRNKNMNTYELQITFGRKSLE